MTHEVLPALFLGSAYFSFRSASFFWWLTSRVRGQNRGVVWWGIANGASYVSLGMMVIVALLFRDALRYAIAVAVVLLVLRVMAGRRLRKGGGGLPRGRPSAFRDRHGRQLK